jgi:multidrug resistance efflux pump
MKRIVPVIILLAVIGGGYWWFTQAEAGVLSTAVALEPAAGLTGSGTIEAETVAITAELGGRIIELKVDEGDEVRAGQVLVELDKVDLLAQQVQLESVLATAKANLELVSASARPEDVAMAEAQLAQAEVARDGAKLTWTRAQALVNDPHELEARINQMQAQVTEAERSLELAQINLKRMDIQAEAASRNQSNNVGLAENEAAQYRFQAAQLRVEMADVALAGVKQQVEHLIRLRDRPLALIAQANAAETTYHQAEAAVLAAEANLVAVKAEATPEDVAVARAQVLEAEAALAALQVQLAKQTLTAPRDGLISQKLVNPSELAAPGAMLLELKDINRVDLVVYIPETRIGQVQIGQKVHVYVDAYGDDIFEGTVTFIAHEAEFTPRNVQTREERVNLVFAVKIGLDNTDQRLKPGMPADAEILPELQATEAATVPVPTAQPAATLAPTATATAARISATPTAEPTSTPAEAGPTTQAEVITWWLNVRSEPDPNQPVIALLAKGDIVPVIDVDPNSGWLQVQLPGEQNTGWISGNPAYVSLK